MKPAEKPKPIENTFTFNDLSNPHPEEKIPPIFDPGTSQLTRPVIVYRSIRKEENTILQNGFQPNNINGHHSVTNHRAGMTQNSALVSFSLFPRSSLYFGSRGNHGGREPGTFSFFAVSLNEKDHAIGPSAGMLKEEYEVSTVEQNIAPEKILASMTCRVPYKEDPENLLKCNKLTFRHGIKEQDQEQILRNLRTYSK